MGPPERTQQDHPRTSQCTLCPANPATKARCLDTLVFWGTCGGHHMVLDVWNCKELLQRGHVGGHHMVLDDKQNI